MHAFRNFSRIPLERDASRAEGDINLSAGENRVVFFSSLMISTASVAEQTHWTKSEGVVGP